MLELSDHSHAQVQPVSKKWLKQIDDEVDDAIERSLLDGSPDIALNLGRSLVATGHSRGIQLARLFYELDRVWKSFDTDDEIVDAIPKAMGVPLDTYEKYRDMYKFVLAPHPELSDKPIGGLIAITVAAREEEFSDKDWEDLAKAHDKSSMLDIRTRVRGTKTKGNSRLVGTWGRDGHIYARIGRGEPEHVAHLPRDVDPDSAAGRLTERIIRTAGIKTL